jgi:hypothetical protein
MLLLSNGSCSILKVPLMLVFIFRLVLLISKLIVMLTRPVIPMIDILSLALLSSSAPVLFLGLLRNNILFLNPLLRLSIALSRLLLLNLPGFVSFSVTFTFLYISLRSFIVIISLLFPLLPILFSIPE